jgi:regulator of sigma E protease
MTIWFILEFVLALMALIIIHELGHFWACRLFKVDIEEFGIGFPPRARTLFERNGTAYTLNWIPIGGFVRPAGENDPEVAGGLAAANPWKRIAVYLAGPLMNILTAVVLYSLLAAMIGKPDPTRLDHVVIDSVLHDSPAAQAGMLPGDHILTLNGIEITSSDQAREIIYSHLDQEINITYERDGQVGNMIVVPSSTRTDQEGATGVLMGTPRTNASISEILIAGPLGTWAHTAMIFDFVAGMFAGGSNNEDVTLVSPIGMGKFYVDSRQSAAYIPSLWYFDIFVFVINLTISLGIFNLLPIPALDGGRIILSLPHALFGKRVPVNAENWVNGIAMMLLLGLMLTIFLRDIFQLIIR